QHCRLRDLHGDGGAGALDTGVGAAARDSVRAVAPVVPADDTQRRVTGRRDQDSVPVRAVRGAADQLAPATARVATRPRAGNLEPVPVRVLRPATNEDAVGWLRVEQEPRLARPD